MLEGVGLGKELGGVRLEDRIGVGKGGIKDQRDWR